MPPTVPSGQFGRHRESRGALEGWIQTVLSAHREQVAAYQSGKESLLGFFVGKVMAQSRGKAEPMQVSQLIKARLED